MRQWPASLNSYTYNVEDMTFRLQIVVLSLLGVILALSILKSLFAQLMLSTAAKDKARSTALRDRIWDGENRKERAARHPGAFVVIKFMMRAIIYCIYSIFALFF